MAPFVLPKVRKCVPLDVYLDFKTAARDGSEGPPTASIGDTENLERLLTFVQNIVSDLDDAEEHQLQAKQSSNEKRSTLLQRFL